MNLIIEKIFPDATLPSRAYPGDAGLDVYAYEDVIVPSLERKNISTGVKLHIPEGYVGLIWDKSSMAFTFGMKTMGGVIDAGYRGELKICLYNTTKEPYTIQKGQKVAQLIIQPFIAPDVQEGLVDAATERGGKGFGSSGF